MDRHDRLYENYENALFSLLMDQVAQEEGVRLLEENERLRNDPNAAVPEELDRRSRETICRAFSARRRARHTAGWYLSRVAVAILAALLLFVTAYALSPALRLRTLESLISASNVSSELSFVSDDVAGEKPDARQQTLAGYALPDISRTYAVIDQGENDWGAWITYLHENGPSIRIYISSREDHYLDSEDATAFEKISVHGYSGMLVEKGKTVRISWFDSDNEKLIYLSATEIARDIALSYAEQIVFKG